MSDAAARRHDAVVVGSGPNGLAAALTLARAGMNVEVVEGAITPGGGCRTGELTLPGFRHDLCSTIQSMVPLSPFFRDIDLALTGVRLMTPEIAFAHPLQDGRCAAVYRSVHETAHALGEDAKAYKGLIGPLVDHADTVVTSVLAPLRSLPRNPVVMGRFSLAGVPSAVHLAKRFRSPEAKGLWAGVCAHSMLALTSPLSAGFGLFLAVSAHVGGWPVIEGGSSVLVDALTGALEDAGGKIRTGQWITKMSDIPPARAILFDTSPEGLVAIAGDRLPTRYRRAAQRFRRGPGICKVDWALSGPVPWTSEQCRRTATVHVGGNFEEVAFAESEVAAGRHAQRPYCIVVQASVVDSTRAPAGQGTLWAYCHVPNGSTVDMTSSIEAQIERFAPGFRDLILMRTVITARESERHNPNYLGGDITGGAGTLRQTLFRPTPRWNPYATGAPGIYLCSASTPPGGGVHGMCGYGAARSVLREVNR